MTNGDEHARWITLYIIKQLYIRVQVVNQHSQLGSHYNCASSQHEINKSYSTF